MNTDGQLGYPNLSVRDASAAPDVDVGGKVTSIAAGENHTCALLEGGGLRCWGLGDQGQLGYGNTESVGRTQTPASLPLVEVGGRVVAVATGRAHTCALIEAGSVRCWGSGENGRLGYANTISIGDDEVPSTAGDVPLIQ
jgi:alpha-tubulin suppressor-like RCC1 family protein